MDIIIPLLIVSVLIGIPTWLIVQTVNKADKSTIIYSPEEVTRRLRKGFYLSFWGMDLLFGAIPSFVLIRSYKFTFWFQLIGVLAGFIVPSVVLLVIFKEFIYCAFGATIGIFWMCVWMLLSMVIPPTRIYRKFAKWYRKSDVSIRDLDEIFY